MKPLQPAEPTKESKDRFIADIIEKWQAGNREIREAFKDCETATTVQMVARQYVEEERRHNRIWLNDKYQVSVKELGNNAVHLSIKRIDREVCKDWRDFQAIKNQLLGPECEAVELYPAESRLTDQANQYHLFGFRDPAFRFPFGFDNGRMVSEESIGGSVQRPFEKEPDMLWCAPCKSYHVIPKNPQHYAELQCFATFSWDLAHEYRHESHNEPGCPICEDRKKEDKP